MKLINQKDPQSNCPERQQLENLRRSLQEQARELVAARGEPDERDPADHPLLDVLLRGDRTFTNINDAATELSKLLGQNADDIGEHLRNCAICCVEG